jgi:hypothetical protein
MTMSAQLLGVLIGGVIGVIGSLSTTLLVTTLSNRRRARAIRAIAKGEVVAIKEKEERFINRQSTSAGLAASTPMLTSTASELGYLYILEENDIPRQWYKVLADLPSPLPPPIHPATHEPVGPEALAPLFPMALIQQQVSTERDIPIPEEVLDAYKLWRPTPLYRAHRLEKALQTPARIYYKYEGVSPAGSHKPNTAVAQAHYTKAEGVKRLTTETGAGQSGSALAMACNCYHPATRECGREAK